jgi:hypothetical protein
MAEIAKEVSTIGGIATVSVLHSFIPTHWLPFSIVGRAQKWSIWQTLLVSKCSPAPLLFPFSEWECLPLFWEMWRTVVIDCYNLHCFVDSSDLSTAAARFCSSQKEEPDFFFVYVCTISTCILLSVCVCSISTRILLSVFL